MNRRKKMEPKNIHFLKASFEPFRSCRSQLEDHFMMVKLLDTLDEAQKRWFVGREAMLLGHGGVKRMCEVSGLSKPTVIKGVKELRGQQTLRPERDRIRHAGGGRKPIEEQDPQLTRMLRR